MNEREPKRFPAVNTQGLAGLSMEALTQAKKKKVLKYHPDKKEAGGEPDEELFIKTLNCFDVLAPLARQNDEKKAKQQQLSDMKKLMHSKFQENFCEQGDKCPKCTETSEICIVCRGCITHKDWG